MHRRPIPHRRRVLTVAALATTTLALALVIGSPRPERRVSFTHDVQPIFSHACISCHPASFPRLDLRPGRAWKQLVRVPAATNPAFELVLPGRPDLTYLLTHPPDPSNANLLTDADRRSIANWIRQGARPN